MYKIKSLPGLALAIAAAATLSACGTTSLSQVKDGHTDQPVWPAPEKAHPLETGKVHADIAALNQVRIGDAKLEIYRLLGHPMYREGIAGVHEWDYLFKLPSPQGEVQCQYKVLFDKDMRASQTFWNPAGCADLLGARAPTVAPRVEPHVAQQLDVSADALFAFGSAQLSAEAPAALETIMTALNKAEHVDSLRVIGYTDRIGSESANQVLSERRAQAVKAYLVSRGVPGEAVLTQGRGAADPVIDCPGTKSPKVVACLKPNRRVRIEVVAR